MKSINLRLFIGAITLDTTKEMLMDYFSQFGKIKSAEIVCEKKSSKKSSSSVKIYPPQKSQKVLVSCLVKTRRPLTGSLASSTPLMEKRLTVMLPSQRGIPLSTGATKAGKFSLGVSIILSLMVKIIGCLN